MPDANGPSVDLSSAAAIEISQTADDRARISWRADARWHEFELDDADSGYVDPEEVMWWMLRHGARVDLVREALGAAFPEFDVDAEIDHVTVPDRTERRAEDNEGREAAKATHRRARPFTVTVEHFVDSGERERTFEELGIAMPGTLRQDQLIGQLAHSSDSAPASGQSSCS